MSKRSLCAQSSEPREHRYITLFQAALEGDVPGKHDCDWLTVADVEKACREVPFPALLLPREAKVRAVKFVDSSVGRSAVWARALRLADKAAAGGAGGKPARPHTSSPTPEDLQTARRCVSGRRVVVRGWGSTCDGDRRTAGSVWGC